VPWATVAQTLGGTPARVGNGTRAGRARGARGVAEGGPPGAARRLGVEAQGILQALVEEGAPQGHGEAAPNWTAPLVRTERAKRGGTARERTVRRTRHRLGYRSTRPKCVRGRPDPAYAETKSAGRASGS
jgi:transposase